MNNLESLVEEINIDKEILSTIPQNNKKNKKIYLEKVEEISSKYNGYEKEILKEIEARAKKYDDVKISKELLKSDDELLDVERVLYLLNSKDSPFEKMDLDREILNLTYYYKKDLAKVNEAINFCIKKIEETGVKLTPGDFSFNKYVSEYVAEVMKDKSQEKLNSKFEQIYWKCPEIITYIELNIRYIYLKNEKTFVKYFKEKKEKLLKNFSEKDLRKTYLKAKQDNIEIHKKDKFLILNKFLEGELAVKDYNKEAIIKIVKKYSEENLNNIEDEKLDKIIINLVSFLNTAREYKKYTEFKFIIDDVRRIYNSNQKYKAEYNKLKKEIAKTEKKVIKCGKPSRFFKKNDDKSLVKQTKLIEQLKEKYKQFDLADVSLKFVTNLSNHSTLYDALSLASLYYKYLFTCIVNHDKEITEEEINRLVLELEDYLKWPDFIILNNIELNEEKDILLIIKDRYNLLNINITKEDLDIGNIENVLEDLAKCELYYYIRYNKINLQEVDETFEFKKILKNI